MNTNERYLARRMFQNLVLASDGQAYEDLFTRVMTYASREFVQVKPQGDIGDRKNDGYDRANGHYFQVYAPENPTSKQSHSTAVEKLAESFSGLLTYWHNECPIRRFSFAWTSPEKLDNESVLRTGLTLGSRWLLTQNSPT